MPELPEVEVVRQGLETLIVGRRVKSVSIACSSLRYPLPDNLNAVLAGHIFRNVRRRAKYLLFDFDSNHILVWHLGMTGQFHVLASHETVARHEHVRFELDGGLSLRYRDARRFGYAALLPVESWERHPWFRKLGPEPLSDAFDAADLYARCRGRTGPIKNVLMNARVVAGVGNIYASEVLFLAGIHPKCRAGRIGFERIIRLTASISKVLANAISAGGSSISDFVQADGKPGYFSFNFQVYGRAGRSCTRCGYTIRRIVLAGRSTFYCPGCQY